MIARLVSALILLAIIVAVGGVAYVKITGLRAQPDPSALEIRIARAIRALAVPADIKGMTNPVPRNPEALEAGMRHFAGYCAPCHGNDGAGTGTSYGRGLFPKAPDMRQPATQNLTDGEIFYIIENGVRFTGMPAFGSGTADPRGETLAWQLVHFIRHLRDLNEADLDKMKSMNP